MANMQIEAVTTRDQQKRCFRFPWSLYRDDPNWIPPLRRNQQELLGFRPHPFYLHNEGRVFMATRDGQCVGRVAAIVNHEHNRRYQERVGFFGFFESVDDVRVARGLFDAAGQWLAERGMDTIRGPVNPSLNYECGLLIQGFDTPPTFMMTYNPPYYERLVEDHGFQKVEDLYAFEGHIDMLESLDRKMEFVVREASRRFNLTLRGLDKRHFDRDVRIFLDIYNQSLGGTWGFTPLSPEEIDHMSRSLRHLIVPQLTAVAEVDGRPIAAVFGLLDYNPRIRQIDGRLFPFGFIRLLANRKSIKRVRLLSTNVVPEYQKWGVGLVALAKMLPDAIQWGMREAEFSWVLESNDLSFKSLKRGGAILSKKYRIYDRPLA